MHTSARGLTKHMRFLLLAAVAGVCQCISTSLDARTTSVKLPTTFKALVAASTGESFAEVARVAELPMPSLEPGEALVRVVYAGVNGGCETFRARGDFAFAGNRDAADFALGAEGVGVVAAVADDVEDVAVGDPVCFVGAGFAEYTKSKAAMLWKVPSTSPEYAALRISALTACAMIEETGKVRAGETVLVTAAAGGAGHFAVQFAKLAGATVIGTTSTEAKAAALARLGCDHVIVHTAEDVGAALARLCPDGCDVVFEGVGGAMLQTALDHLADDGRLLQVGAISEYPHNPAAADEGARNELDALSLFWEGKTVKRGAQTLYGNAWPRENALAAMRTCKERVLARHAAGELVALVDDAEAFIGLERTSDAIAHMLSGKTTGKVVVKIGEEVAQE